MKGSELDPDVPRPDVMFGFGRRICAGQEAAETSTWTAIASLLATFDFSSDKYKREEDFGSHTGGLLSCVPAVL
jgi:cytochrome P450